MSFVLGFIARSGPQNNMLDLTWPHPNPLLQSTSSQSCRCVLEAFEWHTRAKSRGASDLYAACFDYRVSEPRSDRRHCCLSVIYICLFCSWNDPYTSMCMGTWQLASDITDELPTTVIADFCTWHGELGKGRWFPSDHEYPWELSMADGWIKRIKISLVFWFLFSPIPCGHQSCSCIELMPTTCV